MASVVITDHGFENVDYEKSLFFKNGINLSVAKEHKNEEELIKETENANAILVQWANISANVINCLKDCKVIVRYGIGIDNIDIHAAKSKGIAVCNVPDYCVSEVADHTMGLVLALQRKIMETDSLVRGGTWNIVPPGRVLSSSQSNFVTMGFGKIAKAVLKRATAFEYKLFAYDPYISKEEMLEMGVQKLGRDEIFETADILTLHLPLNEETYHIINKDSISKMKPHAIIINTSRGGLIDLNALVNSLENKKIGGAGLDVFEEEPIVRGHPILNFDDVIITSHTAWYSEKSIPLLRKLAVEEVLRGLLGHNLKNRIV